MAAATYAQPIPPKTQMQKDRFDAFGLSHSDYDRWIRYWHFHYRHWLRVDATGLNNVPSNGAAILIGNHAGVAAIDSPMIQVALRKLHPSRRVVRPLVHVGIAKMPALSYLILHCGGGVIGHPANARYLIEKGDMVLVFPEGGHAAAKTFAQRHTLRPPHQFGRGFARMALEHSVPVVPIALVGCETAVPTIFHSRHLGRMLKMDDGVFPISPQTLMTFPFAWWGGFFPFPVRCAMSIGEPIDMQALTRKTGTIDAAVNALHHDLQNRIDNLVSQRKSRSRGGAEPRAASRHTHIESRE